MKEEPAGGGGGTRTQRRAGGGAAGHSGVQVGGRLDTAACRWGGYLDTAACRWGSAWTRRRAGGGGPGHGGVQVGGRLDTAACRWRGAPAHTWNPLYYVFEETRKRLCELGVGLEVLVLASSFLLGVLLGPQEYPIPGLSSHFGPGAQLSPSPARARTGMGPRVQEAPDCALTVLAHAWTHLPMHTHKCTLHVPLTLVYTYHTCVSTHTRVYAHMTRVHTCALVCSAHTCVHTSQCGPAPSVQVGKDQAHSLHPGAWIPGCG